MEYLPQIFKYILIPVVLLSLTYISVTYYKELNAKVQNYINENISDDQLKRGILFIGIFYVFIFGLMTTLKYLTIHSSIFDLGVFDWKIWSIAHGKIDEIFWGHYQPILLVYAVIYQVFAHPLVLVFLQLITIVSSAIPLYKICRIHLNNNKVSLIVILIFFLYAGVEYNTMFDFHTDHLLIPLMLWAYYFLKRDNLVGLISVIAVSSLTKEPLLISLAFLGIFIILEKVDLKSKQGFKKSLPYILTGVLVFIFELGLFIYATKFLIPTFTEEGKHFAIGGSAFGYLGGSLEEMVRNFLFHPWIWIKELFVPGKVSFIISIFFPLLWLPLLKPKALIPALPAIGIAMLSQFPNYYGIQFHYTASIIPFMFIALIKVLANWQRQQKKLISIPLLLLLLSIYFNVVTSPSPISVSFWKNNYDINYNWHNYVFNSRDKVLVEGISIIPPSAKVCIQNNINWHTLMHRPKWYLYPANLDKSEYVLLDLKRPLYVLDKINPQKYYEKLEELKKTHGIIFEKDGVMLFKKKVSVNENP